jgi:1-acyl-sn-glycerol-3-phosphate acyltransferase
MILAAILFPLMHCIAGFSDTKFKKIARKFNHQYFKIFVKIAELLGAIRLTVENRDSLKNLRSKVVIANHPSLFDVVILFSLISNANCIVKGELIQNKFISLIIKNLYIPNNIPFEDQLEMAKSSMDEGNNLIIFPEGTRSKPGEPWEFKKGAARFALYAKREVVPIFFGGNEKIGLRKHDKLLQFHPTERYLYNLKVLPTISIKEYENIPITKSATKLTHKMKEILEKELPG